MTLNKAPDLKHIFNLEPQNLSHIKVSLFLHITKSSGSTQLISTVQSELLYWTKELNQLHWNLLIITWPQMSCFLQTNWLNDCVDLFHQSCWTRTALQDEENGTKIQCLRTESEPEVRNLSMRNPDWIRLSAGLLHTSSAKNTRLSAPTELCDTNWLVRLCLLVVFCCLLWIWSSVCLMSSSSTFTLFLKGSFMLPTEE